MIMAMSRVILMTSQRIITTMNPMTILMICLTLKKPMTITMTLTQTKSMMITNPWKTRKKPAKNQRKSRRRNNQPLPRNLPMSLPINPHRLQLHRQSRRLRVKRMPDSLCVFVRIRQLKWGKSIPPLLSPLTPRLPPGSSRPTFLNI